MDRWTTSSQNFGVSIKPQTVFLLLLSLALLGAAHEPGGVGANLAEVAHRAHRPLLLLHEPGAASGARDVRRAPVDGRERRGANHKGVSGVVVELNLVLVLALASLQHLLRLLRNLDRGRQLEQPPGKLRGGVEVLQLEAAASRSA